MAEGIGPPSQNDDTNTYSPTSNSSASTSSTPCFLDTPEGRRLAYHRTEGSFPGVVFIHGLNSSMNGVKAMALEQFCRQSNISYLRFNLSGHGESSLNFKDCDITMWLEDLIAVLKCLTSGPQILVGSSIGGWLMFLYTMRNPENIHGLIGVGAAPDFTEVLWKGLSKEEKQEVKKTGHYELPTPYCDKPYELTMDLIQDGNKYSIMDMPGIEYVKSPVLLFHGELDTLVPPSTALKIVQKLQCPVSLKTVQDGDHRLSRPQDIELITNAVTELLRPPNALDDSGMDLDD